MDGWIDKIVRYSSKGSALLTGYYQENITNLCYYIKNLILVNSKVKQWT